MKSCAHSQHNGKTQTDASLFGKQNFGQSVNWRLAPSSPELLWHLKSWGETLSVGMLESKVFISVESIFMKHFWRCEGVEIYSSLLEVNIMALWGFAKPQPLMTPAKSVKAEQPLRSPQKLTKHRENLLSGAINFFLDTSFALYSCSNRFSLKTSYLVWELMKCRVGCVVCSQCESRK